MLKKMLFALIVVTAVSNSALAAGVGIYGAAGFGGQTSKNGSPHYNPSGSYSLSTSNSDGSSIVANIGVFYEQPAMFNMSDRSFLGISAEYGAISQSELDYSLQDLTHSFNSKFTTDGYMIPITVYYKYKVFKRFAVRGGLGANYLSVTWNRRVGDINLVHIDTVEATDSKFMPFIYGGLEWIFSRYVTLGGDLSYSFNCKISTYYSTPISTGKYERDFSGVIAKLVLRLYVLQ